MRRGQVALYLLVALVVLALFAVVNASAFLAVRARNHTMNAGDAAALAVAKEQGRLLNEIGQLNLRHAEADYYCHYDVSRECVEKQRRLAFLSPVYCLKVANEEAKKNGAKVNRAMTKLLTDHVQEIYTNYIPNPDLYPEPWEGAWREYANAIAEVAGEGLAVGIDNIDYLDLTESFPLTSKSFYSMIMGEAWCKIVVSHWEALLNYDHTNMPRPESSAVSTVVNSEICSLHLRMAVPPTTSVEDEKNLHEIFARNGASFPDPMPDYTDTRALDDESRYYFLYDKDLADENEKNVWWREWREIKTYNQNKLPILGSVKPQYDVLGCTAVCRVIEDVPRLLRNDSVETDWSAAARPFGTITTLSGNNQIVTADEAFGLVLPGFTETRLIPLAAAYRGGNDISTADAEWMSHVRDHLQEYLANGVGGLGSCQYCRCLKKWESAEYRANIQSWIEANADSRTRSRSGGSMDGGGTAYAH